MSEVLKFDDLPSDPAPQASFDSLQDDGEKYGSTGNKVLAGLEGAANIATVGLYGKAAKAADEKLGLDPEYHSKVAQANPISHSIGQVAGLAVGPVGEAIGAAGNMAKGLASKLAIENALFQTTDEVSKAVMNDPNQSLQTAATNITLSGLLGGAFGMTGGLLGKGIAKAADSKVGEFLSDFKDRLQEHLVPATEKVPNPAYLKPFSPGFKEAQMFTEKELPKAEISTEGLTLGQKAADAFMSSKLAGHGLAGSLGYHMGHATGLPYAGTLGAYMGSKALGPALDAIIKPIMKGIVSGEGLEAVTQLVDNVIKGDSAIVNASKAVFDKGLDVIPSKLVSTKEDREHIKDALNIAQDAPESILNAGGRLDPYMPSHNVALGQLTGNAVQYLSAIQPRPSTKANPLDSSIPPSKDQITMYNRALDIANQPLTVMQHIKDGTLMSHDLATFMAIYPQLHQKMAQSLTNSLIEHQSKGHAVPYRTRVGLSMFLNQPMDSTMTARAIQSAQSIYIPKASQQPSQQEQKPQKGSPKALSKFSTQYQTADQSRAARRNK